MKNILNSFKSKRFICVAVLFLILNLCNAYTFVERYNSLLIENITSFSFWNYMRMHGIGELILFFCPVVIVFLGLYEAHEKMTTSFLKFELMRTDYKKKMIGELFSCYFKGAALLIVGSLIIFVIGTLIFSNSFSVLHYFDYLNGFNAEAVFNPFLYVFIYHILIILFCMFIINIGLIVMYYIKDFILIIVASFISLTAINIIIGNIAVVFARASSNETFREYAFAVNVYEGYAVQSTMLNAFINIGILFLLTLLPVIFLYKNKEKVVMRFD